MIRIRQSSERQPGIAFRTIDEITIVGGKTQAADNEARTNRRLAPCRSHNWDSFKTFKSLAQFCAKTLIDPVQSLPADPRYTIKCTSLYGGRHRHWQYFSGELESWSF